MITILVVAVIIWIFIMMNWGENQQKIDKELNDYSDSLKYQHELIREMRNERNLDGSYMFSIEDLEQAWKDWEDRTKWKNKRGD